MKGVTVAKSKFFPRPNTPRPAKPNVPESCRALTNYCINAMARKTSNKNKNLPSWTPGGVVLGGAEPAPAQPATAFKACRPFGDESSYPLRTTPKTRQVFIRVSAR